MNPRDTHIRMLLAGFAAIACFISWSITNDSHSAAMRSEKNELDRTEESKDFINLHLSSSRQNTSNLSMLSYYLESIKKKNTDAIPDQIILHLQHTIHVIREKIATAQTDQIQTIEELERARETLNEMLQTYKNLTTKEP